MKILIGIPCYQNVSPETLDDYMRLAYYCGRRIPEHDFSLGIKTKTEQYRARNAIVEGALQVGADYLLFLDDDHVIDWEGTPGPNSRYGMIEKFLKHFDNDPKLGIVGAVYYHRGNECRPVLMNEGTDGAFYWIREDQITGELQTVGVQGGGCMMIRMSVFDRIKSPWFEAESSVGLGTDIQICKKAREAGFKVACDTSIQIGHVLSTRQVIHPNNRHRIAMESAMHNAGGDTGMNVEWLNDSALSLYRMDAEEFLGMKLADMGTIACRYDMKDLIKYKDDLKGYYATRGKAQLARQVVFHHTAAMRQQIALFHSMVNTQTEGYGCEYGCGSAPVSFELALRGHRMDFIDVEGSTAYEFTKWRVKKRGIESRCGFMLKGPYDYVMMLDAIEHIQDWKGVLTDVIASLKDKGALITNYFGNNDYANPEHVSMDKQAVKDFLIANGIYPMSEILWVKADLSYETKQEVAA